MNRARRPILLPILAGIVAVVSAPQAEATTLKRLSLEELSRTADAIVIGVPESAETFWEGGRILTRHRVRVDSVWHGNVRAGESIEVVTMGGIDGKIGQYVAGAAQLVPEAPQVLFLSKEPSGRGFHTVGMWQGVFDLQLVGPGQWQLSRREEGRAVGAVPAFPSDLDTLHNAVDGLRDAK